MSAVSAAVKVVSFESRGQELLAFMLDGLARGEDGNVFDAVKVDQRDWLKLWRHRRELLTAVRRAVIMESLEIAARKS